MCKRCEDVTTGLIFIWERLVLTVICTRQPECERVYGKEPIL